MSIEQSNQLILLILNSVLMTFLSAALLGGAWLRQSALSQQLYQIRTHYQKITHPLEVRPDGDSSQHLQADLKKLRSDRYRVRNQYLWSRLGTVTLHAVLLTFSVSLFALALRSLISYDSLISAALFLFATGSAGLLAGLGCILIDIAQGDRAADSIAQSLGRAITQVTNHLTKRWQRPKIMPKPVATSRPPMVSKSR